MSQQGESNQRELAQRIAASADEVERAKLLTWAFRLVQIRDGEGSVFAKGKDALSATLSEGVAWPVVKLIGAEIRRLTWDERGLKWRAGFIAAIAGGILAGGQGAGIAALGGAIGVPLWLVLGAGGSFLAMLYEELIAKAGGELPREGATDSTSTLQTHRHVEVVDVEAKVIAEDVRLPFEQAILKAERGICPGDTLRCGGCGYEREVSQSWLDTLARRYTPTAAGRLTSLDGKVLRKFMCSECGAKELQLVMKLDAEDLGRYRLCSACGGDGGYEGRCYKCFGSGFEQAST